MKKLQNQQGVLMEGTSEPVDSTDEGASEPVDSTDEGASEPVDSTDEGAFRIYT